MNAGLNLYSLRKLITTEEDFLATAKKLKQMGYSYLQYSGAEFDPERIRRVSQETSLPVVLTHVPYDRIINDTEKLMEEHQVFGCHNIGLGMVPFSLCRETKQCLEAIEKMEKAAEKMEKAGFHFFYHNHHLEFFRIDGRTYFDRLIEEAPHLNFTLDTYWVQNGGGDILKMIDRLAGRIGCVHLKDYTVGIPIQKPDEKKMVPVFAPVGSGSLDFPTIVEKMKAAGTQYFLVEQDNAVFYPDPLGQVEESIRYIREEL